MTDVDDTGSLPAAEAVNPPASSGASADRPGRTRLRVWLAVAATALAVLGLLGIALFTGLLGAADADVPNVVGTTEAYAREALANAGFKVGAVTRTYSEEKAGTVLGQSPLARARAPRGSSIELVVSNGAETLIAPTLIGLTEEAAQALLAQEGLGGDVLPAEYSAEFEPGQVIRQSPAPGERIARGGTVKFVLAGGRAPRASGSSVTGRGRSASGSGAGTGAGTGAGRTPGSGWDSGSNPPSDPSDIVTIPRVIGMVGTDAEAFLLEGGFEVRVKRAANSSVRAGEVFAQDPLPGTQLPAGSTVTITISSGPGRVSVPNVMGLSASEAKALIVAAGLRAVSVYQLTTGSNKVVEQYPRAGTTIDPQGAVTITVDGRPK